MDTAIETNIKEDLVGDVLAGKYRIEELLREDEFGSVYRGLHLLMEKPVTVKVLAPELAVDESIVERFSFEAKTISRLSHPNILNITDFGRDDVGNVFIVMELVGGRTVADLTASEGGLPFERSVRIVRQAAAALSAAHSNNVLHGSLSSSKILVSPQPNGQDLVKIFDFGLFSGGLDEGFAEPDMEDVKYLSPEQCTLESEPDERSDLYSLGIVLYELLTGEVPFTADTAVDLMAKHAEVPPPPLAAFVSDIPEEIEPILLNLLAKIPDRRYQSAAALADDLSEVLVGEDGEDTIVIPKVKEAAAGNLWKTAFIALAGMLLVAFGLVYWTGTRPTETVSALPTDAGSQPVQPLNPATGVNEQGNLMTLPPGTLLAGENEFPGADVGGGDGYDPWGNVPVPPSGGGSGSDAPIGPGGQVYTIPGDGSIFMEGWDGGGVILVPKIVPAKSPETDPKASPSPDKSPAKVEVGKPSDKPAKPADSPSTKPKVDTPKADGPAKPEAKPSKPPVKPADKSSTTGEGV